MNTTIFEIILIGPPLLIAIILHEVAHGVAAERLGDPTARSLGRISLNPIRHIDPFMTIILPVMLKLAGAPIFAGAKPVPVNPRYFKRPRRGMAYVAVAGPITNFILATISYVLLHATRFAAAQMDPSGTAFAAVTMLEAWFTFGVMINLLLGGFNLLPIPPLDGGRIAVGFLPLKLAYAWSKIEPYGILIVFALLYSRTLDKVLDPLLKLTEALVR